MKWKNPYNTDGVWLKGNLHTHSTVSDGLYSIDEVIAFYRDTAGYDFLAMTDHAGSRANKANFKEPMSLPDFTYIMGREESVGRHIVGVGVPMVFTDKGKTDGKSYLSSDYQKLIDDIAAERGLSILAHPHWRYDDYWSAEAILKLNGATALEIINGDRFNGPGNLATDVWDEILTGGKLVWGIATDDFHHPRDYFNAWTMVRAASNTQADILRALSQGSCYASNGAAFESLETEGDCIIATCSTDSIYQRCEKTFRFIGEGGKLLQLQMGKNNTAVYKAQGNEKYVRVELSLDWGYAAFSQPFFAEP